jgi:hypothetical protein
VFVSAARGYRQDPVEKSGPVLVGLALIGALSGVLIAGHGNTPGVVNAAPAGTQLGDAATTTVVASAAPLATSAQVTSTMAAATSTTEVIVASEAAVAPSGTPTAPAVTVADTVDIPAAQDPEPTIDTPAPPPSEIATEIAEETTTTAPPTTAPTDDEPPAASPDPPWAAGSERATVRVVVANADTRPDLDEATLLHLAEVGYTQIVAAADVAPSSFTTIYYREGFNRAAVTLAIDLQADEVSLEPMPATPVTNLDDQGDLVVVLGPDVPI